MIRSGYARHLQAEAERSRLTEQWQGYPQPVRQSLHALLRDHGLEAAQCATEVLVEYAASETRRQGRDTDLSVEGERRVQNGGSLKGNYQYFPLPPLLAPEHTIVVDTDFEMVHLMRQSSPPFVLSQRFNDVELAILLPVLRTWPAPASYEALYESLCVVSWEGAEREFRHSLPLLLNACAGRLSRFGMEIVGNGSSLQLVSCA